MLSCLAGVLFVTVALAGLYGPVLIRLAQQWWNNSNDSYGCLIPIFCLWVVWRNRRRLRSLPLAPANGGFAWMLLALLMLLAGTLGAELLLTRLSLVVMIAGLLLALAGRAWLRALAFPLAFLVLMFPLPTLIYNLATLPLEALATRLGVGLVSWSGMPIMRQGNLIVLPGALLNVVAACSGIRSLLALLALAGAYGYIAERDWARRLALLAAMVPLAVLSNAVRIALTILLTLRFGEAASHGFWHFLTGLQVFAVAVLGLALLQRCLHPNARRASPAGVQHA
jgi:exosortase